MSYASVNSRERSPCDGLVARFSAKSYSRAGRAKLGLNNVIKQAGFRVASWALLYIQKTLTKQVTQANDKPSGCRR